MSATHSTKKQIAKTLAKMVRVLSRKSYLTVQEIATRTGFSTVTTYKRLGTLDSLGCKIRVATTERAEGQRGPAPVGYRLVENSASRRILTAARS